MLVSLLGLAFTQMMQTMFSGLNSGNIAIQAQQYAASKAELIKLTKYDDLTAQPLKDVPDTQFQDEVELSAETITDDDVKQRTVTVSVYKKGDSLARVKLKIPRSNAEKEVSSGVPIGTIIAWSSAIMPKDGGTWLLCNGQSTAAYPQLQAIVGSNVPDYRGVFLRGYGSQVSTHYGTVTHSSEELGVLQGDAIRNITGRFVQGNYRGDFTQGAFYQTGQQGGPSAHKDDWRLLGFFDAGRMVPTANENRPVNKAVYWLIKAA